MAEAVFSPWDLFRDLLPRAEIDALDPRAPQAVYTPFVVLWLLVFQRLEKNASLAEAVAELVERFPREGMPGNKAGRLGGLSANTGAYSAARSALDAGVLKWAADRSFDSLSSCYPPSFLGKRVFLLDGTSLTLKSHAALKRDFPPASNQHGESAWPVIRMVVAHDLDSGLMIGSAHGPMNGEHAVSEQGLTKLLLPRLPAGSILLADRNFGVFSVAWAAARAGLGVVARLTGPRFRSLRKRAQKDETGRLRVAWTPTAADRKSDPSLPADARVEGWLHEADLPNGEKLWLFATEDGTTDRAAELYKRRGDVETDIRDLKVTLDMAEVTGRGKAMVEKEILAARLAYNLTNQVRRLAAAEAGVEPRKLSFAGARALVKAFLGALAEGLTGEEAEERFDRLLRRVGQRKLPNRKPGRSYARTVHRKRQGFPTKKRATKEADA